MKKIFSLLAILAAAVGLAGCSQDMAIETVNKLVEVKAYTGGAETRTTLSESESTFKVLWSEGDKIAIGGKEFALSAGNGTTSATFTGEAPADGEYTAYYPSTYKGTTWPDQKYAANDGISGAPMVATATVTDGKIGALSFKNVGGVLRYTVKGNKTIKSINIKGNGIDMTLDCGNGVALTSAGTVFNFALPAGTYTNATLSFLADDNMMATMKAPSFIVKKNVVSKATFEASALNFEMSTLAPVGSVNTMWGREAVIVDLGGSIGKVAVATQDAGALPGYISGPIYSFTEAFADNFLSDGWYIPSAEELYQLSRICTWDAANKKYYYHNTEIGGILSLPANGWDTGNGWENKDEIGFYLTSNTSGDLGYGFCFQIINNDVLPYMSASEKTMKGSVRPFHKLAGNALPEINDDSPVGTLGMCHGQEAVVVDLGVGRYAIATKNVGANTPSDFGNRYGYSNLPTGTDGWRLPTKEEIDALISKYAPTSWTAFNGVPGRQFSIAGTQLFFPAAGVERDGVNQGEGAKGMCWVKPTGSADYSCLSFSESTFETEPLSDIAAQTLNAPVRLVCKLPLAASDPVGLIGYIDGREAMVVDLGESYGKVAVALCNEGATNPYMTGIHYKWDAAMNLSQTNGWYVPSWAELQALCTRYPRSFNNNGGNKGLTLSITSDASLFFPVAGLHNFLEDAYINEVFVWTSGAIDLGNYYAMRYNSQGLSNIGGNSSTATNVRLFHKLQ